MRRLMLYYSLALIARQARKMLAFMELNRWNNRARLQIVRSALTLPESRQLSAAVPSKKRMDVVELCPHLVGSVRIRVHGERDTQPECLLDNWQ